MLSLAIPHTPLLSLPYFCCLISANLVLIIFSNYTFLNCQESQQTLKMHHPEGDSILGRDSSQTLTKGALHHAFGEEEECQLPKQVHAGDFHPPYVETADEGENRSYRSAETGPSKNMKVSNDSKIDYRIESRTLGQNFMQSQGQRNTVLVKSPSELAKKYETKLSANNNVSQYSENDTKLTKISRSNTLDQHAAVEQQLKDLSLDQKISKIDMIHDSSNGLSQRRQSINESYFGERDSQRDQEGSSRPRRSLSRSNPRKSNQYPNLMIPDKTQSPSDPKIIDDEITERIRLQGEKLIQQPDIVENQPHKQLERAMKDQKSSGRNRKDTNSQVKFSESNANDNKTQEVQRQDVIARKHYNGFSRETSGGREEGTNKNLEIFDGSFGRKKREDADYEKDRKFRYKIEAPALLNDHLQSYEQRNKVGGAQFGNELFEGRFGSKGPSGRTNRTTRFTQREMFGIGAGITAEGKERTSASFRHNDHDALLKRESRSIPRDPMASHIDSNKYEESRDKSFMDLIKGTADMRRTASVSPYGGMRNSTTFKSSDLDYRSKFMNLENAKNETSSNRYRSPLDDLYKQHNNKNSLQKKDEPVDKQFQQCQELLQRAKDRRMKMSQENKDSERGIYPARTSYHASKNTSFDYDAYKISPDVVDVPNVKALQTRYDYLMDTIKEKESEVSRTEHSLTKSGGDKDKKTSSYAKTMKWKKGEKHQLPPAQAAADAQQISEYKSRPLRVPKPPQGAANQTSNISSTYDWLMKKHEAPQNHNDAKKDVKPHHVISFGQIQDGSSESLKNSQAFSRAQSLGRTQFFPNENDSSYMARFRNDFSAYSRGRSQNSNERSFYKPLSPEAEQTTANINRMQYVPFNQKSQERQAADNSLERDNIRVPGGIDYQMKIFGTQPQIQKKFQIERRTYDNLAPNNYELAFPTKTFEQAMPSKAFDKAIPQSQDLHKLIPGNFDPLQNYGNQSNTSVAQAAGQIGKIVRQGQKLGIDKQASFQSTQHYGDFENSLRNTSAEPHPPTSTTIASNVALTSLDNKLVSNASQLLSNQELRNSRDVLQQQAAPQTLISQQTSAMINLGPDTGPTVSPSLTTPKTSGVLSQSLLSQQAQSQVQQQQQQNQTVFQRLDRLQAQIKAANCGDAFKFVFYSKYQPSYQFKQFNGDFIAELVSQLENITAICVERAASKGQKNEHNPLSSLDFNAEEVSSYEQIGQHLNDQYDTKKDPNMWVPQLYADMCKARTLATKNEDDFKKEKEKNKELMQQIETLEKDLLTFRKDLADKMENNQSSSAEAERKLRDQAQVEFEWMERIDALISSQKYYKQGDAPGLLPESAYDIETANPKKVFSQLLNKLEVLLCHQELEKSKTKKLMTTTVKQMDARITGITEKFSKIQRKIIETCSFEDDNDEGPGSCRDESVQSSNHSEAGSECPTMRGTIDMLKKIRRDREEQEKIIEQLKQIIQIQDKVYKADFDKLDASFREQVIKNIENFVTEEHKKAPRSMQLAWVAEVSEISMSQDILDGSRLQGVSQSAFIEERAVTKSPKNASMLITDYGVGPDDQSLYQVNKDQNHTGENSYIKVQSCPDVLLVSTEVQTEMPANEKMAQSTKVYKEIKTQTDPMEVGRVATADEGASEQIADHKSTTTTERRAKQLNTFSADLQHNMNELLTQQLSKHLQSNMSEIATIKQENGRLIEKYKNEQKQVAKLKEEVKRKQKYEQFFEKQRAKKYRNCGCQVGPSQLKFALDDQHSSSFHFKSTSSAAIKSQQNVAPKRVNKENQNKLFEKIDGNTIVVRNVLKSPMPTVLRSPEGHDAKSATDFTSLNTQLMQQKYGVAENSTDEKHVEFTNTRGNSQILGGSGDYSKCASYTAESPLGGEGPFPTEFSNHSEKQLLHFHIQRNQELHELLRSYLTKFDNGTCPPQEAQAMMAWLQPPPNIIEGSSDTLNQRYQEMNTSKEHEEQAAASMLASSANFGLREPLKESKGHSHEKKKTALDPSQQLSLEFSEQTENTKKCDYIDQYFTYKNSQKREQAHAQRRNEDGQQQFVHQQSFGEQYALQAALALNQRSSSGKRGQVLDSKQQAMFDRDSKGDQSRSEKRSKKTDGDEHVIRHDDDVSDNINVSEQIKSIEGRQMILCEALEAKTQQI